VELLSLSLNERILAKVEPFQRWFFPFGGFFLRITGRIYEDKWIAEMASIEGIFPSNGQEFKVKTSSEGIAFLMEDGIR